jgi:hypothetical protein
MLSLGELGGSFWTGWDMGVSDNEDWWLSDFCLYVPGWESWFFGSNISSMTLMPICFQSNFPSNISPIYNVIIH